MLQASFPVPTKAVQTNTDTQPRRENLKAYRDIRNQMEYAKETGRAEGMAGVAREIAKNLKALGTDIMQISKASA